MKRSGIMGILTILLLLGGLVGVTYWDVTSKAWVMPKGTSSMAGDIDFMYEVILWVTTGMFFLTEGLLILFCILYRERPGHKATYTHGSKAAEIVWTIIPAIMLFSLAIWQKGAWVLAKDVPKDDPDPVRVEILAQQFTWKIRYPGPATEITDPKGNKKKEVRFADKNDFVQERQLVVPVNKNIVIQLRSRDVIHSFFLPMMRVKQDAVPGMTIPVWFKATEVNAKLTKVWQDEEETWQFTIEIDKTKPYEIACAELCGAQHYAMSGQIVVLSQEDWKKWIHGQNENAAGYEDGMTIKKDPDGVDRGAGNNWGWPWGKTDW